MNLRLGSKVTLFVTAFLLAIGAASTAFFLTSYQRGLRRVVTARGITLAEALARGVAQGIAAEDLGIIQQVQSIVRADDVVLAQVYSSVWLPIDSYPTDNFNLEPEAVAVQQLKATNAPCAFIHGSDVDCYAPAYFHHMELPKEARYIVGFVRVRLSTRVADAALRRDVALYLGCAALVTLFAIAILNLLIRRIVVRPIERLDQAVFAAVADGTFATVAVTSTDELGHLSASFNLLFAALQERERSLRASEDRFATAFRVSPDAITITRIADGTYLDVNEGFTAMTGWAAAEIVGASSTALGIWVQDADRRRLVQGLARQGAVHNLVAQFRGKDGHEFTGLMSAKRIETGGDPCILAITRDITEREHLSQQRQKIEKLEAVGVLAGGIAHDFNNILTAILGNISFAMSHVEEESKAATILGKAEKAAKRAAELAHQLLTFARGGQPVKRATSIQQLLEESASLLLRGSSVAFVLDLPADLMAVDVDPGQINQVANNIILNALQAMPDGGTLTIAAANTEVAAAAGQALVPGRYVRVTFTDTGCGISEEHQRRIFDPYFSTKASGSGLGLASCHSVITRHGGGIQVRSILGQGTTFELLLPASATGPVAEGEDGSLRAVVPPPQGRPLLVMDDEDNIRDMVADMLDQVGYDIQTCSDGQEAIALYRSAMTLGTPYAAVIMDLTIPGRMGGREAAQHLLALDPEARLVVSSGYSNDPVMADPGKYGFCATLMKPYTLAGVVAALADALGGPGRQP